MLKLTKKADYGLIALRHLAVARPRTSASAKDIADSYGIPLPLLSKVLQKLARGGLLISEQGTNGGYRLSRDARDISALEAIRVIDGPIILTKCFTEHAGCDQTALCPVREPLRKVHEGILSLLANISLSDLAGEEMQIPSARPPLQNIQLTRLSGTT
jgi:Rrf2 family protein